jgi:AraC-like DNA-binding protein
VLGLNYRCLTELAGVDDDEQLAHWLRDMFERVFAAMQRGANHPPPSSVSGALGYIRGNLHRDVTRDETARHVGISPSHLSRLLRERTGRSYTQLLREARIALASELLATTEEPLIVIAGLSGFCDQSYFTHVFQQSKHMTPRQFREAHRVVPALDSSPVEAAHRGPIQRARRGWRPETAVKVKTA